MAADFRFALLGPVRAWRDGAEVHLGGPQQRAVLAVLPLRAGGHVTVGDLIRALWEGTAAGTVRTYVHRLRRLLCGDQVIRSAGHGSPPAPPPRTRRALR